MEIGNWKLQIENWLRVGCAKRTEEAVGEILNFQFPIPTASAAPQPKVFYTNFVLPGTAIGSIGSGMSQVRLSGTSFHCEFIAISQVTSCPV